MSLVKHVKDVLQGKAKLGQTRSGEWRTVRKNHLKKNPNCAVCNGTKKVEVHHLKPFHTHPEDELNPHNLITLCESNKNGLNCHQLIGHVGDFHSVNTAAITDSQIWNNKLKSRPKLKGTE